MDPVYQHMDTYEYKTHTKCTRIFVYARVYVYELSMRVCMCTRACARCTYAHGNQCTRTNQCSRVCARVHADQYQYTRMHTYACARRAYANWNQWAGAASSVCWRAKNRKTSSKVVWLTLKSSMHSSSWLSISVCHVGGMCVVRARVRCVSVFQGSLSVSAMWVGCVWYVRVSQSLIVVYQCLPCGWCVCM